MYTVKLIEADGPVGGSVIGRGLTRTAAAKGAWRDHLRTDAGPLAKQPRTFEELEAAVADALGGEAAVVITDLE